MEKTINHKGYHSIFLGKLMPPHKGHQYIIDCALGMGSVLVVLDKIKDPYCSQRQIKDWLIKEYRSAYETGVLKIQLIKDYLPQDPIESKDFWQIWASALHQCAKQEQHPVNVLIGAMDYIKPLADAMGVAGVALQVNRELVNIGASDIRANLWQYWEYLMPSAKNDLLTQIAITGPESTGKTRLAKHLANEFKTVCVPEFAADFLASGNAFNQENLDLIFQMQRVSAEQSKKYAKAVLFHDSLLLTTWVWAKRFGLKVSEEQTRQVNEQLKQMHTIYLTDALGDVQPEAHRLLRQEDKAWFLQTFKAYLVEQNIDYKMLPESLEKRVEWIKSQKPLSGFLTEHAPLKKWEKENEQTKNSMRESNKKLKK